MSRYFIEFSYKGTNYKGFQKQPDAISIQEALEKALSVLLKTEIEVVGSSRTDAGVHASQQFAHFDTMQIANVAKVCFQLNKILPADIAIKQIFEVAPDYHARFAATARRYEYHIEQQKNPFNLGLAYHYSEHYDVPLMNEAAQLLLKHNDFEAFSKVHTQVNHFRCQISDARWVVDGSKLIFHIKADRFLRGMVRAVVGTLLLVGTHRLSLANFEQVIISKNRSKAGRAVPPQGLFLVEVLYE